MSEPIGDRLRMGRRHLTFGAVFARFAAARGGAAAVEFALLSIPFFLLMFGIIELALIFLLVTTLENATGETARRIRTGELQANGGANATTFKQTVCDNLGWLSGDCANNLFVDVRTFTTFQSVNMPQPVNNGVFDPSALTFDAGKAGDIVVVRAYYQWPFMTPLVGQAMQQLKSGKMLITSTVAFRNEPFGA